MIFNIISALTFAVAVFFLVTRGLHFSYEFTGGTVFELHYAQPADLERIRGTAHKLAIGETVVQSFGTSRDVLIRIPAIGGKTMADLKGFVLGSLCAAEYSGNSSRAPLPADGGARWQQGCKSADGQTLFEVTRAEYVGPSVGAELAYGGAKALIALIIGVMVYLAIRFEWKFAVAAIIANLHDIVIILGIFALFQWEFSPTVLAAVLAVLGYSVNESVVVFDRIREAFRKYRKLTTQEVIDHAITSTMSRTIITHGCTQLMVLSMLIFGGPTLTYFAAALTIGILFGIYSSVFVAAGIAMWLGVTRADLAKSGGGGGNSGDPKDPNSGAVV